MTRTAVLLAVLALSACGGAGPSAPTAASPSPTAVGECPERYEHADEPWVPAPPTTETPGRLVPDADPVEALVCRYGESGDLDGEALLEDDLDRIRTDLLLPARVVGAERACTLIGGGLRPHLVRLRYADGELWVSAVQEPNLCSVSGNGAFVTSAYLGDTLARSYDARSWVPPDLDPCSLTGPGRAGQERALVPAGWTSLVVCAEDGGRREVVPDMASQVASLVDQLTTEPGTNACDGTPRSASRVVFTYAAGPPVQLWWTPGCEPSLSNGSLSAVPTPAQTELLGVLLA